MKVFESFIRNEDEGFSQSILSKYQPLEYLGCGSFSQVFKVICDHTFYAIKVLDKIQLGRQYDKLRNEAQILQKLNHKNIVKLIETLESQRKLYFVMELVEGMTLDQINLQPEEIVSVIKQILEAVTYIHSQDIIHRDLKLENIMINQHQQIKIIDFGLSFKAQSFQTTHDTCGTLIFMAPEMAAKGEYFKPVDIWSCGIIQYMLFAHKHPLWEIGDSRETYQQKLSSWNTIQFPKNMNMCQLAAKAFFKKTASWFPESRMSAGQALMHPWITGKGELNEPLTMTDMIEQFTKKQELNQFIKGVLYLQYLKLKCPTKQTIQELNKKQLNLSLDVGDNSSDCESQQMKANFLSPPVMKSFQRRSTPTIQQNTKYNQSNRNDYLLKNLQSNNDKKKLQLSQSGSFYTYMDDNDFKYNKNPSIHRYSLQVKDDKKNNIILPYNYYTFKLLYNSPIAPRKQVSSSNTNSPITKQIQFSNSPKIKNTEPSKAFPCK